MFYVLQGQVLVYKSEGKDLLKFTPNDIVAIREFDDWYYRFQQEVHRDAFDQIEPTQVSLMKTPCPFFALMCSQKYKCREEGEETSTTLTHRDLFYTSLFTTMSQALMKVMVEELKLFVSNKYPPTLGFLQRNENPPLILSLLLRRMLGDMLVILPQGSIFGERALEEDKQPRSASIVTSSQNCL